MPATSEKQRRFFGAVMGAKKGKKGVGGEARRAAGEMSEGQIKDFLHKKSAVKINSVVEFLRNILKGTKQWGSGVADLGHGLRFRQGDPTQFVTGLKKMFMPGDVMGKAVQGTGDVAATTIGKTIPTGILGGTALTAGNILHDKYSTAYNQGFLDKCAKYGIDPRKL